MPGARRSEQGNVRSGRREGGSMSTRSHALRRAFVAGIFALALPFAGSALAAKPDRPYSGSCSTVVTPLGPPPIPGVPQLLDITYDCTLAHLGRTTAVVQQV